MIIVGGTTRFISLPQDFFRCSEVYMHDGSTESLSKYLHLPFLAYAIQQPFRYSRVLLKGQLRPIGYPPKICCAIHFIAYRLQRSFADLLASRRSQLLEVGTGTNSCETELRSERTRYGCLANS